MKYNFITDNSLLIVPNNIKEDILKELNNNNQLLNIKFMSKEELKKKYYFDYDNRTIYYLISKYNYKVSVAINYLENMYFIENKKYSYKKLNDLLKLKQELEDNKLLIKDKLFISNIKNKNIIVYGYDYIDKFYSNIFNELKRVTNVEIIEKKANTNKELSVYEFSDISDEVEFIARNIIELVNSGISINNIKLANVTDEYKFVISKIFNFYNIPVIINSKTSISETRIGSYFLRKLNVTFDLENSIENVKNNFEMNNDNINLLNQIINVCNNYYFDDINENIIKCIEYDLKNTFIKSKLLENYIGEIKLEDNIISDDIYVFLLGFNQGSIPTIYKDEDYISDYLKTEINIETTLEKNIRSKQVMKNIITNIKNLIITYKLKTPFEEYHKSLLVDEMNMNLKEGKINLGTTYSKIYDEIKLCSYLDDFVKFNKLNENVGLLYNNYQDINYLSYDNKFKGLDKNNLYDFINNKLLLSYSSIDKFYRCKFRYYVGNILRLEKYEETFPIFIGNLFHYILSIAFNTDFKFEEEWNNYLNDKTLTNKEKFFLNKLKTELQFIIDTINYQMKRSNFKESLYEQKIFINKDKNIKVTFMGIIDKILYEEKDGQTLVAIIDYKTGNPEANLNNTIYGIEMQLPVYLYLIKNSKFKNIKVAGFYLQKILNNETILKPFENIEDVKKENLKLVGYSNSEENILYEFDNSYKNSELIKSMKVGNNGFYSYSKVLNDEKISKLSDIVEEKIDSAINEILEANFEIDPKRIGLKNYGCEFCKFKDVCFMTEKDIVNLEAKTNLDFLGSDE